MIKKIILIFILSSGIIFSVLAKGDSETPYKDTYRETVEYRDNVKEVLSNEYKSLDEKYWGLSQWEYENLSWNDLERYKELWWQWWFNPSNSWLYNLATEKVNTAKEAYENSTESDDDISSAWFKIKTSNFSPGWSSIKKDSAQETVNSALTIIIQKLMIALWVLSLFIMTIWAGYMIMYHGQDELLSKWKSIFMSGIIALIVALSSYYLVSFVRFILYN